MSSDSSRSVKIRLEIEVPQGGPEPVALQQLQVRRLGISDTTPNIIEPPNGSSRVNARQDTPTGPWIICTTGTNTSPGRPLFYGVYLQGSAAPPVQASFGRALGLRGQLRRVEL